MQKLVKEQGLQCTNLRIKDKRVCSIFIKHSFCCTHSHTHKLKRSSQQLTLVEPDCNFYLILSCFQITQGGAGSGEKLQGQITGLEQHKTQLN